jgi:hypothetical protein
VRYIQRVKLIHALKKIAVAGGFLPSNLDDIEILTPNQRGSFHAKAWPTKIELYPLFFSENESIKQGILAHELGHWYFYNASKDVKNEVLSWKRGVGFWHETAPTSEEGFADMFSQFLTEESHLRDKYPKQYGLLKEWVGPHRDKFIQYINKTLKKYQDN